MSSRTPLVPHHAEPGHWPPMGGPDGSGCHHLSARILCLHGPGRGSYMKVPNPSKQRPLAAWENGLASKHPCFISAFKIKTLCASANAGGNCHSSGQMKRAASALMPRSVGAGRGACLGMLCGQPSGRRLSCPCLESAGSPRAPRVGNGPQHTGRRTPATRCPSEPAFCTFGVSFFFPTFSTSEPKQQSCTNVTLLEAVWGPGCRGAEHGPVTSCEMVTISDSNS